MEFSPSIKANHSLTKKFDNFALNYIVELFDMKDAVTTIEHDTWSKIMGDFIHYA